MVDTSMMVERAEGAIESHKLVAGSDNARIMQ